MQPLSILHFSRNDLDGGSARSAQRLHRGLQTSGQRSRMLVGVKDGSDPDVDFIWRRRRYELMDRISHRITESLSAQYAYLPSSQRLPDDPWVREADIIQLFNIHGGYFSPRVLPALAQRAPIVWRLSDAWPMTGHCSYPMDCERWRTGCGACPDLRQYPALKRDRTAELWAWKRSLYRRTPMTVVAPSSWTERLARESPLFEGKTVVRIPNGLDGTLWRPADQTVAREAFGLPADRPILLFAAHGVDANPRKGVDLIPDIMRAVAARMDDAPPLLALCGRGRADWAAALGVTAVHLGYIEDPRLMRLAYGAADLVLAPAPQDNLPNVVLEAMACGRPVAAFDAGGVGDAVKDGETGVLAPFGDVRMLADGVAALLRSRVRHEELSRAARAMVVEEFTETRETARFLELYRTLTGRSGEVDP